MLLEIGNNWLLLEFSTQITFRKTEPNKFWEILYHLQTRCGLPCLYFEHQQPIKNPKFCMWLDSTEVVEEVGTVFTFVTPQEIAIAVWLQDTERHNSQIDHFPRWGRKWKTAILLMAEILHQLRLVVYPNVYRVSKIPGGAGFVPSTVPPPRTCIKHVRSFFCRMALKHVGFLIVWCTVNSTRQYTTKRTYMTWPPPKLYSSVQLLVLHVSFRSHKRLGCFTCWVLREHQVSICCLKPSKCKSIWESCPLPTQPLGGFNTKNQHKLKFHSFT